MKSNITSEVFRTGGWINYDKHDSLIFLARLQMFLPNIESYSPRIVSSNHLPTYNTHLSWDNNLMNNAESKHVLGG